MTGPLIRTEIRRVVISGAPYTLTETQRGTDAEVRAQVQAAWANWYEKLTPEQRANPAELVAPRIVPPVVKS